MREWDRFCRLIGLFVGTGLIHGEKAASALFIGQPGSGKSSAILRFRDVRSCMAISDLTVDPLRKVILPDVRDKGYRHLLFPDFWKLFQRKDHSVGNTVGLLSALISGEFERVYVGTDIENYPGVQAGMIGAMPTKIFQDWKRDMGAQGILDRLVVFPWDFSREEQVVIEKQIANGNSRDLTPFPFPDIPKALVVTWNPKLTPLLMELVDSIKKEHRNRLVSALRSLTLSAALLQGVAKKKPGPFVADRDALDLVASYGDYFRDAAV